MATNNTDPEALLERLFDAFENERWEEYPEILADDIVAHENGEEIRGLQEQLDFEKEFKKSNPGAAVTVEEMATSGNTVFSRGIAPGGGTHLLCAHVDDGEIAEFWVVSE
jgi:hypothetical protein